MFILFWLVGSICVGIYWANKGGSGFWATFFALIFSPVLAGLCCLVAAPNTRNIERRQIQTGQMQRCPACAELVRGEAILCRYCGAQLVRLPS